MPIYLTLGAYSDKGASGIVSGDSGRRAATDGFLKFLQDYPKHRHQ